MARAKYKAEQIIPMLREAEVETLFITPGSPSQRLCEELHLLAQSVFGRRDL